ncbi:MAG: HAMP domain-containing protein, partial [Deltaproteobacteria bacterium]|nr:HAMP domain-containing protein [Deltaproteobacteria bacterium]
MPIFRTVRSRVTAATTLIVAVAMLGAGIGVLVLTRRALVSDVRGALTDNLAEAREDLNRGVVTELGLLSLGASVDTFAVTTRLVNQACSPILAGAYGAEPRAFADFLDLRGIDAPTFIAYDDCVSRTDPYFESSAHCEQVAIDALGNPEVTFAEFQVMAGSEEFAVAYDECLSGRLLVDERIDAAAQVCDRVIVTAFDTIDVLDRGAVEQRIEDTLFAYAACMRGNGVPDYPDLTFTGAEGGGPALLSGVAGPTVLLPSLESVRGTVDTFGRIVAVAVPTLIVLLALLTWVVVGRVLRPVEQIRSRVAGIGAEELDRRVPDPGTDDEVGRLAATMNRMLDRLQRSAERQRQFVSDASHELRSPIASIRTQLEVAQAHPDRADWDDVATGVLEESGRMERLVDDLLTLARAEEGVLQRVGDVDLGELMLSEVERVEDLAVDTTGVGLAVVQGDALALRRVISNLLDNARRHARSAIALGLTAD